jgi:hypothetical protein
MANMKIRAFWEVVPCSLRVDLFIALMMEAVRTFETSVYSNETTLHYIESTGKTKYFQ